MQAWELYRTLSSKSRLKIIEALRGKSMRYSEIMRETGLNTTDVSRQLQRLSNDSIVLKYPNDRYALTQYGILSATSIPTISFLVNYMEYFNSHDISYIPEELMEDIAWLRNGTMVNSIYEAISLQSKIIPTIQRRYWMMTDDISPTWIKTTLKLVEEGVQVLAIVTPELANKMKEEAPPALFQGIETRTMEQINLIAGYSDKHALLCFPTFDGVPDRNHYIFGYDFGFKHWVYHCFDNHWRRATRFID